MPYLIALGLSLAAHLLMILFISMAPLLIPAPTEVVEVEFVEKPQKVAESEKGRQRVRATEIPDEIKVEASNDMARFLSLEKVRVKQETRAAAIGMTENRANTPQQGKSGGKTQEGVSLYDQGIAIKQEMDQWKKDDTGRNQQEFGLSTVGEVLPDDVKIGGFTALNSDRYTYYTFFARIEEQVRYRWESEVKDVINRVVPAELRGVHTQWITHTQIYLKPNGEFHSAAVMKESGIHGFDRATVTAFREAKMFPHPPKEMVGPNGLIKLEYSFYVNFDPQALAARRSGRSVN
ncbi:MAG: energy transducer TonB [Pseudobdellovibrionaceae bacterium]